MESDSNLWAFVVRAEGAGPPVEVRLRRLLKHMLRTHGIRCVAILPAAPETGLPAPPASAGGQGKGPGFTAADAAILDGED